MKDELIAMLESFNYPVFLQGSMTEDDQYPKSFFTIWNSDTDDGAHYDNDAINFVWDFSINFYSVDPDLVDEVLIRVKQLLKNKGWIVPGKGYDVPTDEPSHTGRAIDVLYVEKNTL